MYATLAVSQFLKLCNRITTILRRLYLIFAILLHFDRVLQFPIAASPIAALFCI